MRRPEQPELCAGRGHARRHGLSHRRVTSRTTGRTRRTSCFRTTCSNRMRRGACRRTCSWSRPGPRICTRTTTRARCRNAIQTPGPHPTRATLCSRQATGDRPIYAWTDLTYLLHQEHVSWGYYVVPGTEPDCRIRLDDQLRARAAELQGRRASGTRCPTSTPFATTASKETSNRSQTFYAAAQHGAPARTSPGSCPPEASSEHPPARDQRRRGVRDEPYQRSHAQPRTGTRPPSSSRGTTGAASTTTSSTRRSTRTATASVCPGSSSAPTPSTGYIDHQILSFDAYLKFIEDDFLNGQRLDPRPTAGPTRVQPFARTSRARKPRKRLRLQPITTITRAVAGTPQDNVDGLSGRVALCGIAARLERRW